MLTINEEVRNAWVADAVFLGVQPQHFGFPMGLPQPAPQYQPPAGTSSMARELGKSRRKAKIKARLKSGRYSVHNGEVLLD
jgi:hypothetical protein